MDLTLSSEQPKKKLVSIAKSLIELTRPHQWLKNTFIFLPLFFGGQLRNLEAWNKSFIAFIAFSFIASSIYAFNDICDIEADRNHPKKNRRPLASGALSKWAGYATMIVMLAASGIVVTVWGGENRQIESMVLLSYFVMNIAYTLKLKHYPLIDVFIIALGFVLRVVIGGIATDIYLSHWIILMTFLLALFLAFAKRRDDVMIFQQTGVEARKKTKRYNLEMLNLILSILATVTIVCYIMYTVSDEVIERFHNNYVYVTSVFVLIGIFRYLQLTLVDIKSGSPTEILIKDFVIQSCIGAWMVTFTLIIYFL
jgi:4-hydroxybenzoate polyprenyltransferase